MECLTLKKSNCKNCYKCIRHCPVKSIRFTGNQAYIIGDECIMCGHCFVVCPQDAKQITDETEKVKVFLQSRDPVVVSLAPSFVANFDGVGIESMREALKQLGLRCRGNSDRRDNCQERIWPHLQRRRTWHYHHIVLSLRKPSGPEAFSESDFISCGCTLPHAGPL